MNVFEALVNQYLGRTPPHFDVVASRIREGQSALAIRRQLEDDYDLTRFQAGKIVDDVEKAITAWRTSLGTGIGLIALVLIFVTPYSPIFWIGLVVGVAQTVAGMRGMQRFQSAVGSNRDAFAREASPAAHHVHTPGTTPPREKEEREATTSGSDDSEGGGRRATGS